MLHPEQIIKIAKKILTHEHPIIDPEIMSPKFCAELGLFEDDDASDVIEAILDVSLDFIKLYDSEKLYMPFLSRKHFFEGGEFCILPTQFELTNNILVPGHRFIPFCKPEKKIKLRVAEDNKAIKLVKRQYSFVDLLPFFSFLGPQGMTKALIKDFRSNVTNMANRPDPELPPMIDISVYNMEKFYHEHSFAYGDMLRVKLEDYDKGKVSVKLYSKEEQLHRRDEQVKWLAQFASALSNTLDLINENNIAISIDHQLGQVYYSGGRELMSNPPTNFIPLINDRQSNFYIQHTDSGNTIIWDHNLEFDLIDPEKILDEPEMYDEEDDEFEHPDLFDDFDEEDDELSKFDQLSKIMGFQWAEPEFEAYIRDELYTGGNDLQAVIDRCFDDRIDLDYPDLKDDFLDLVALKWKQISSSYNRFADTDTGKIRHSALDIYDIHLASTRKIDKHDFAITPEFEEKLCDIMEVMMSLYPLVCTLNEPDTISKKNMKLMQESLKMIKSIILEKMQDVESYLGIE
jgi:hypothetical protein